MKMPISAWFAGPKSENSESFVRTIRRILEDHQYWRRNYFPEDGVVITSEERRRQSHWNDLFEDKLMELLAALKSDCPFHSPRYAAHMLAEQTLPSIAGYFAGMLYNPNNVSREAAPTTVLIELEVGRMIAEMLGYDRTTAWAHLTSGGTVANLEALWVARTVRYLPFLLRDVANRLDLHLAVRDESDEGLLKWSPDRSLALLSETFEAAEDAFGAAPQTARRVIDAYRASDWNVGNEGIVRIVRRLGSEPVILVPETHHYCLPKHGDVMGLGQRSLRKIRVDTRFRMDVGHLAESLEQIDGSDQHVLAVVAVVGTTEEGAVDPVDKIAALREEREAQDLPSFWLHCDAAYGGYLRTTMLPEREGLGEPEVEVVIDGHSHRIPLDLPDRQPCDAMERLGACDSIIVDPHKLGYVPYPAGVVAFKSNLVRPLMRQNAPYIEEEPAGPEAERFSENIGVYILEGSKPGASAASVWLSHASIPLDTSGHGKLVRETIRNACELTSLLEGWPNLAEAHGMEAVVMCPPESNIVCYAFRPREGEVSLERINKLNQLLHKKYSLPEERRVHVYDQRFFVSRTLVSPVQYSLPTLQPFLRRLQVTDEEFLDSGVFLLRSTLMNPWYGLAKQHGRDYLVGLVTELHESAATLWAQGV